MSQGRSIVLNLIDAHHSTLMKSITRKTMQKTVRSIETHRFLFDFKYFNKVNSPEWMHDNDKSVYHRTNNSKSITDLV